jgi:quercetin dioxygenase-like cupin family protein
MNKNYQERLVRYKDLIPCKNAFVDSRSPGSNQKENFTIIGPGVSENPNQHVHIPLKHGFNIGGARQPAGCLNSQHSHDTAEVFIVHSGKWRFYLGVNREDGYLDLEEGSVISLPIHMFRGFENIGGGTSYLFAVLGGDDPGKVVWAPAVFEMAKKYGLVLLKGGKLIDTTTGEKTPEGAELETPPGGAEIAQLKTPSLEKMQECVVHYKDLQPNNNSALSEGGITEAPIITPQETSDGFSEGPIAGWWPHGFNLRLLKIKNSASTNWHTREEEEVILQQSGSLKIMIEDDEIILSKGDQLSIPKNAKRKFCGASDESASFVVRGTDNPQAPKFV